MNNVSQATSISCVLFHVILCTDKKVNQIELKTASKQTEEKCTYRYQLHENNCYRFTALVVAQLIFIV